MEPTTTSSASAKVISALIIGLIVGFAAGVFWQDRRSADRGDTSAQAKVETKSETGKEVPPVATGTTSGAETSVPSENGLMVEDQAAGGSVEIASLDTKEVIWVAVREDKDGALGNILGAQKIFVGEGQKVTVELLRPTVSGNTYRVVLYRDIGTPAFNHKEDVMIEGVEGMFVAK